MNLKQSTAVSLMIFMLDSTDHRSGKTGLTLVVTASKAGAAFASITPTAVNDRGSGWYEVQLDATHTNTLGALALHLTATGADPNDLQHQVGPLDASALSIATDAISAASVSAAAASKIGVATWAQTGEGSDTYGDMLRGIMSGLLGKVSNFLTNTLVFKGAINASKTRWTVVTDSTGRVTSTKGDLTP